MQALSIFECRRALVSPNGETSSNPFLYYKVPKGPRLKGVYTPFRGCRLSLRGLKMSFEERRARVFKSLLLIPSRREQYMRQAKCSQKREYLNSAKMRILTSNTLMSSVLQEFQQQYPRFRCSVGRKHRRVQTRPAGTSGKGSKHHMHLNLNKNRKYHHNSLSNFQLQRFAKKSTAFRCTGKQQHLNFDKMRIQAPSMLTSSVLKEFQQQYPNSNTQGSDAQWE